MTKANSFKDSTDAERARAEVGRRSRRLQSSKLLNWRDRVDLALDDTPTTKRRSLTKARP